jgi:glycosyltransferase involved in cell wall biosynthesis
VVTPSFNQARFLAATMESIHGTGYPNLEHIVIDGGSDDGSVAIIEGYADRLAFWVSEPDAGQTDALIKGFARATGDILCWLNSDDLFEPWTLFEVAEFFSSNPEVEFVYGDSTWVDAEGAVIKPKREHGFNRFVWLYDHNFIPQPSTFWRRSLYDRVGGLDPGFDLAMDADLWIRFADHTTPRHVRRPWSRMRFYPEQKNTAMRARSGIEGRRIRARYLPNQSRRLWRLKHRTARFLRFWLKALSGGYPPSEIVQHLGSLIGRGSWEQRQVRRSADSAELDR